MKKLAIIDGNSLINRAYYAMREPMITKEGIYTQGIFGFINMLNKIIKDYEPTHLAVAFDMKAPTFRHKEYKDYKAGRKKMPMELAMQLPLLKEVLTAMNIFQIEAKGYEADDIIGTVAKTAEENNFETYIITGDKDQLQLATDKTKVIITKKGVSQFDIFDYDAMVEKYGFTPTQFIDYKGLMGDQSDNIPGVPGVGEKSASKLILEFGNVESIIENIENIKPKGLKTKLEENSQLAVMSKRLATIYLNVPMDDSIDDMLIREPAYDDLIEIYKKLEFNKFLRGLEGKAEVSFVTSNDKNYAFKKESMLKKNYISDEKELAVISLADECIIKIFGVPNHLDNAIIDGVAIISDNNYYYFDLQKINNFFRWLKEQNTKFIGHNLKDEFFFFLSNGIEDFEVAFDTEVAQYLLDSARSNYDITALSNELLHESLEDEKSFMQNHSQLDMFSNQNTDYMNYGLKFCLTIYNIKLIQELEIIEQDLKQVLYEVEFPLIKVMASMEFEGFNIDKDILDKYNIDVSKKINDLTAAIYNHAEEEFNIASPAQLGEILFNKMMLTPGKKTKRGYSTNAEVLEKIKDEHEIVSLILEYRFYTKLKSTYVDGLTPLINKQDGRIHPHFNQTVTTTGRISCAEPNLQNIPVRQEIGRKLRKAFIPHNYECMLISADYSQIELRVLAHMAQDQQLIESFNNGEDIHAATASRVLGIPENEITTDERSRAKAVNFGVIYGMSAFGLSTELDITRKEAENYINTYFEKHSAVKSFMDEQIDFCKANGYITTLTGRKRYVKEINASNYMVRQIGERLAMNTPIQGTAADIIKIAMVKVYDALKENNLKSKLILQVHDELVINTYKDEEDKVKHIIIENMEKAYELLVSLKADLSKGNNWYELK